MRFAIIAALVAVASGQACDVSKLTFSYYTDAKCTTVDADRTKRWGKVPNDVKRILDGKCHGNIKSSSTDTGFDIKMFKQNGCKGGVARDFVTKWDGCTLSPQGKSYTKITYK